MWFSPCSFLMFSVRNCSNSTCGAVLAQYLLLGYAWICWDLTPRFDMSSGHPAFHIVELFAFSRCLCGRMVLFAFIYIYIPRLYLMKDQHLLVTLVSPAWECCQPTRTVVRPVVVSRMPALCMLHAITSTMQRA